MLKEPLPEGAVVDEPVRLCVEADLRTDGKFGKQWLVVTGKRLHVFSENGDTGLSEAAWALEDLSEVKAESFVGGGAVLGMYDGKRIELVRYTNARSARFMTATHLLEKWMKGEEAELPEDEAKHCPRCGLPLEIGTQVCPACLPKSRTIKRLVRYLKPHWGPALTLAVLSISGTALNLLPPYLNKPLFDSVLAPKEPRPLEDRLRLLGLLVLALLATQVTLAGVGIVQAWVAARLGNFVTHDIRCELYEHLQYLSLRFFDKRQMGTVISRVNQDTGQLQQFLVWGSQDLASNVLLLLGIGTMLFVMSWKLALMVFVPAPLVMILSATCWKKIRFYMHRMFHRWGRLNSVIVETLNGLRVVKTFAQEPREISRFNARSLDLAVTGAQAERMAAVLFSGLGMLIMLGSLLVWYEGGRGVLDDSITLGTLSAFMMYVGMFYGPVRWMSMLLNWASRSLTAAERVFEVLDSEPDVKETDNATPMPHIEGRVTFEDVTFGYDPHSPVLKHINFEAKPGEMIGFVGHSGAGKTTCINLLCRFYDADEGRILVDGVPLRELRVADLRHQIGVVPQDTFLFSGSIADNIAYAKPGASKEEIIRAAKIANAHDFIVRKPDGYESWVGEGGQGLSAGERQRLAIARAVLHDPRILILDEATSSVDVETEKQIQAAIQRLIAGRTTFAIAHRLSTLKNADRLIVLKGGEITEIGTHDELLAKEDGEFRKLVDTYQEISKVRTVEG
jgi:ATP-binding cassette subfamily B protein